MSFTEQSIALLQDRRLLLRHVLQKELLTGSALSDAVVDELDVPRLLRKLSQGQPFDLSEATRTTNPFVTGSTNGVVSPAPNEQRGHEDDGSSYMPLPGTRTQGNFDAQHLRSLTYLVFLTGTSLDPDEGLLRLMRRQLKIPDTLAGELHKAVAMAISKGVAMRDAMAETLRLPLLMLQALQPEAFGHFEAFVAWQQTVCDMLVTLYTNAANQWQALEAGGRPSKQARHFLARLRACVRRLSIREEAEYDRDEYEDATKALTACAHNIAEASGCGYKLPFGLRVRLCELMLSSVFDSTAPAPSPMDTTRSVSSLGGEVFVDEKDELLESLQRLVWPVLGISKSVHATVFAWIHFRQFSLTSNVALLRPTKRLLQLLLEDSITDGTALAGTRRRHSRTPSQMLKVPIEGLLPERPPSEEEALPELVAGAVADWAVEQLGDYHAQYKGNTRAMQGVLDLLAVSEGTRGVSMSDVCDMCCQRSLRAEFARAVQDAQEAAPNDNMEELSMLAAAAREMAATEASDFGPILAPHLPMHATITAIVLHGEYGRRILPWFGAVRGLTLLAVQLVRAAEELEGELERSMQEGRLEPWGLSAKMAPLLYEWVGEKLQQLREWRTRLMDKEDWTPVTKQQPCGRSALELVRMSLQTVDSLFEMRLQLPAELVRTMLLGIDESITKYADFVSSSVGSVDSLIPPPPPMTRFKKDLWQKSIHYEAKGKKAPLLEDEAQKVALQGNALAPLAGQRNVSVTTTALVVRMNCLSYVYDALPSIQRAMEERWISEQGLSAVQRASTVDVFTGVLQEAKEKLERAMDRMCRYAAYKVIWWDMTKEWQEFLYRWSVDRGRLNVVLQRLDAVLGQLVGSCADSLSKPLARNMLRASVSAYKRVLLDGGAARWFVVDDVPMLEEDVRKLSAFFEAGGDGLPAGEIQQETKELEQIVRVMALPTAQLEQRLDEARMQLPGSVAPGDLLSNKEVLTRVLCHRAEREASKIMKKDRIPKKSGSGAFSNFAVKFGK